MTAVGYVSRTIKFLLGTKEFQCAVTAWTLTPNTPVLTTSTLCPNGTLSDVGETTWTLSGTANVDWTTGSMYAFLVANAGTDVQFEVQPTGKAGEKVTGTVTIVPPAASMPINQWATFQFSLPLDGEPTFTWGPAPTT